MGFCIDAVFTEKIYSAYISHELIVRLKRTWIWYDLHAVSQIWPSNHQLSYFSEFCQFKVAQQPESIAVKRCFDVILFTLNK